jgi:hypothetical protein
LSELCDILDVPRPDPATPDTTQNEYVFERAVTFHHGDGTTSAGRIDLYKRGCFVLEAKQGSTAPSETKDAALSKAIHDARAVYRTGVARRGSTAWDGCHAAGAWTG